MSAVVSNSSPLIALERIGRVEVLERLFGVLVVPLAVQREVEVLSVLPVWVKSKAITQPLSSLVLSPMLGAGESEVICLALEIKARLVLLDNRPARRTAQTLGLNVIGTIGVLLSAKNQGLLPALKPCLDELQQQDFRIAPKIYEQVLIDAGEA